MAQKPLIGQILIADGAVSEEAVARALGYQRATRQNIRLGSILLDWDLLAEDKLLAALSKLHRCPPVTWAELSRSSPEALQTLSAAFAMRLGAFPYTIDGSGVRVAFGNPSDLATVDEVFSVSRKRLVPGVATEAALVLAYHRFYGRPVPPDFRDLIHKVDRGWTASARSRPAGRSAPVSPAVSDLKKISTEASDSAAAMRLPGASGIDRAEAPHAVDRDPLIAPIRTLLPPASEPESSPRRAATDAAPGLDSNQARVADFVVDRLLEVFPRVLMLGVGKSAISGWAGRGPGLTPEVVAALRVQAGEESVVPEVARSGLPHFGPAERDRISFGLRGMLEREAAGCAVFPICVSGMVAGILYADRLGDPMLNGDSAILSDAARTLESLFSESDLLDGDKGK